MEVAQEAAGSGFVPFTPVLSHLGQLPHLLLRCWSMGTHPGLSAQCWGMRDALAREMPCSGSCKVLLAKGRVTSEGGNEKLLVVTGNVQDHKSTL